MDEHSDTWAFSWMPAIEDFVDQATSRADAAREDSGGSDGEGGPPGKEISTGGDRTSRTGCLGDGNGDSSISSGDESDPARGGRKRRRTQTRERSWSRRTMHPPSYNETLLADKAFHNPHASEIMADAFGVFRPASFLLDVGADDRPWGGTVAAAAAKHAGEGGEAARAEAGNREKEDASGGEGSGTGDRSWFYDTVRDRQNRLWADTRVRKGVELARKGQHQVRAGVRLVGVVVRSTPCLEQRSVCCALYSTCERMNTAI